MLEASAKPGLADEFHNAQDDRPARIDRFAILDQQRHARFLNPAHGI
jgi:hypothetical protein